MDKNALKPVDSGQSDTVSSDLDGWGELDDDLNEISGKKSSLFDVQASEKVGMAEEGEADDEADWSSGWDTVMGFLRSLPLYEFWPSRAVGIDSDYV